MTPLIIKTLVFSTLFIAVVHHIVVYFKNLLTTPKYYDLYHNSSLPLEFVVKSGKLTRTTISSPPSPPVSLSPPLHDEMKSNLTEFLQNMNTTSISLLP